MKDFNQFILDLSQIISFNTELGKAEEGAPFGKNTADCLNAFLDIAKSMGFETYNYDNYIGEVRFGQGQEIGIIGHLDVVPAGEGWETDPYTLTFKDGCYYARGVSDDKGPTLLALYALKELKESGIKVNKNFRLFVGCNEETGWRDVEYYNKIGTFPEYGFSPDGNFPVVYAEKGVSIINFKLPLLNNFEDIKGGTVINAVCAHAQATFKDENLAKQENVKTLAKKYGLKINGKVVESFGKSAHGSHPELGVNAILALMQFFAELGEDVQNVIDCLFMDKFGLGKLENAQGKVTMSPDLIYVKNGKINVDCDCRIPAPLCQKDVQKVVDNFGIEYSASEKHPPVMVDKDGWFVNALLRAYNEVTGENESAQSMGGSTFARVFEKGCAFGMEFANENTHMHEIGECVSKESLEKAYDIYLKTLYNLCAL